MNTRKLERWILLADLLWIACAFFGADFLRFGLTWESDERAAIRALLPFIFTACGAWIALSLFMPMDGFRGGWRLSAVLSHLLLGTGLTLALLTAIGYFTRSYVSRLALTYFTVLLGTGFIGMRCGARMMLRRKHRGGDVWRVVVLGSGRVAQEIVAKMEQHPEMLCKVVGLLFPSQNTEEFTGTPLQESSQLSTFAIFDLLQGWRVNEVIVALPQPLTPEIRTVIGRLRDTGFEISVVPEPYELYASKPNLISLDGLPLLQLREPGLRPRYLVLKRLLDVVASALLLIPCSVALLPISVILLLKKQSALRWETRSGQYGVPFQMLRLNVQRPVPQASKFERLLEHVSVTELPQLWNVLRGQMSLVGPRPESPRRSSRYSEWQQRRLRVKPGMTGLAQVHGLREHSSSEEKSRFDLQYVMGPYLLWDISLLLQTLSTLLLRVLSRAQREKPDTNPDVIQPINGLFPHAHRTQPSPD